MRQKSQPEGSLSVRSLEPGANEGNGHWNRPTEDRQPGTGMRQGSPAGEPRSWDASRLGHGGPTSPLSVSSVDSIIDPNVPGRPGSFGHQSGNRISLSCHLRLRTAAPLVHGLRRDAATSHPQHLTAIHPHDHDRDAHPHRSNERIAKYAFGFQGSP